MIMMMMMMVRSSSLFWLLLVTSLNCSSWCVLAQQESLNTITTTTTTTTTQMAPITIGTAPITNEAPITIGNEQEGAVVGTNLGGGVVTRTKVDAYAKLALDLRDMKTYNNQDAILRLYDEGHNAQLQPGFNLRLKDLSSFLSGSATLTPNYLFQLYGMSGELSAGNSYTNYEKYADSFVRTAINTYAPDGHHVKPTEAMIALNMWMYATHLLQWGVDICAKQSQADNPDAIESLGGGGFDEFIALWIGSEQASGTKDGFALYAWAQEVGELFQSSANGATTTTTSSSRQEVDVNYHLKLLYQQGAGILSLAQACTKENQESVQQLWIVVQQMISKMYIPQLQRLILAIQQENAHLVQLYATAIIPQTSQCRPSVYKKLKDKLMDSGSSINFSQKDKLLNDLQQIYGCFGLSCQDIGSYNNFDPCQSNAPAEQSYTALAGYPPSSDVTTLAQIDLDILQIELLSSMKAYGFAHYVYMYGKNSMVPQETDTDPVQFLSLHQMATSSKRQLAEPYYSQFVSYFNDNDYANKVVMQAFDANINGRSNGFKWKTPEQRTAVIVTTCSYQIVFLYFIAELNEALTECQNADPNDIMYVPGEIFHPWDEVAALYIGSLEGSTMGGSSDLEDGQLLWNLANKRAFQFQTLNNEEGFSDVNSELDDLFFAGKGELDALDCFNLDLTVKRITKKSIVGIVQSILRSAILTENVDSSAGSSGGSSSIRNNNINGNNNEIQLAIGEILSLSVLPIINSINSDTATYIEENMIVTDGVEPIQYGSQSLADAFGSAVLEWGVSCKDLGYTSQVDPCKNVHPALIHQYNQQQDDVANQKKPPKNNGDNSLWSSTLTGINSSAAAAAAVSLSSFSFSVFIGLLSSSSLLMMIWG